MSDSSRTDPARQQLLGRVAGDPFFLGSALAGYRELHAWTADHLADWLRCSLVNLDRLALCRRPVSQDSHFRQDVERIAAFGECDAERLAALLREASALSVFQGAPLDDQSSLLAARDRRPPRKRSET